MAQAKTEAARLRAQLTEVRTHRDTAAAEFSQKIKEWEREREAMERLRNSLRQQNDKQAEMITARDQHIVHLEHQLLTIRAVLCLQWEPKEGNSIPVAPRIVPGRS